MTDDVVLHAALVARADCYTKALALADELVSGVASLGALTQPRSPPTLRRLLELIEEAAGHEATVAVGGGAGPELTAARDRVAALLEQLGQKLQVIERIVRERRDRLAVELDACNRRRQMQRAYQGGP